MKLSLSKPIIGVLIAAVIASGATAGYYHDQSIKGVYASLTPDIYNLKNQIDNLNNQVRQLQNQNSNLQSQNSNLQAASVDGWFTFSGSSCYYSCTVNGAYTNYGTQDAKDIVVTLTWKNNGGFVQSNTISLGNLAGRTVQLYPQGSIQQYFTLAAPANQLTWAFTWAT
jgi:hypothetical protein